MQVRKSLTFLLLVILQTDFVFAQTPPVVRAINNPCQDSLYILLKDAPPVSLTESERRYVEQKEIECKEYLAGKKQEQKPLPIKTSQEKQKTQQTENKIYDQGRQEEFFTVRNVGIITVIVGAVVGLAVALGNVTKAPF